MNKKNTDTQQWIPEIREFVHERDAALRSLDRRQLLAYFQKYQIPVPENEMIFWASVHRARLGIRHITQKEQEDSALWLMKHGFSLPQETNPEVLQHVRKKGEA